MGGREELVNNASAIFQEASLLMGPFGKSHSETVAYIQALLSEGKVEFREVDGAYRLCPKV